jgi:mucin-like protein
MIPVRPMQYDCERVQGAPQQPAKPGPRAIGWIAALLAVAAIGILVQAQPARTQAPACPPGGDCPCTWSGWLDRDDPSGVGDFETLVDFAKEKKAPCLRPTAVQCRYKEDKKQWGHQTLPLGPAPTPVGYTCTVSGPGAGGVCQNAKTKPPATKTNPVTCRDSEVRFCCPKD